MDYNFTEIYKFVHVRSGKTGDFDDKSGEKCGRCCCNQWQLSIQFSVHFLTFHSCMLREKLLNLHCKRID